MMPIKLHIRNLLFGAAFGIAMVILPGHGPLVLRDALAALPPAASATLAAQTNQEGNVSVTVEPRNLSPHGATWDFAISFNSHVQAVEQDPAKAVVLIDSAGRVHAPIGWEGDPPGSHHRKGVLRFTPLPGRPTSVELQVRGIGGVHVRTFRWRLE